MTNPPNARSRRARIRRTGAAVLLASGLAVSGTAVASAGAPAAASTSRPSVDVVGLKKGAYGDAVKALQEALVRVGVGVKYGVDSYFGSATEASVKAFQRYKGLPVTGVVDQATAAALGLASAPAAAAPAAAANGSLARGSTGQRVTQLQQSLIAAGIPVAGGADGIFGVATERALRSFQQAKGLSATGAADAATLSALGGAPAAAAPAAAATSSATGLRLGNRGPAVVTLQQALIKMGWTLRGGADGIFGANTQSAVILAQRSNGINGSGVVDNATARLLGLTGAAPAAASAAAAPAAAAPVAASTAAGFATYDEHGSRVVALQNALIGAGITVPGGADGVFGAGTAGAVMAFQRVKGLSVSGKVDAATASALGLAAADAPAPAAAISVAIEAKPVQGPCYYGDTWSAARGNGRSHLGVDILAAEGNQLYAVATGTISQIYVDAPGSLSGNGLKIRRPDGTYFFYAHLSSLAPGIAVGTAVTAGQLVGYVGHTGNAAGPHLHLEVHPGGGSAVNPYTIVKALGAC
jgi:peptidoglycan hydrolase-like protein with peptidoglycan-binding domain